MVEEAGYTSFFLKKLSESTDINKKCYVKRNSIPYLLKHERHVKWNWAQLFESLNVGLTFEFSSCFSHYNINVELQSACLVVNSFE